ncbi:MAG: MlaD family protein [Bacteroidaceae bacterium]
MMIPKISREVKIGFMAVCAITLLIFGINFFKGVQLFQPTKSVHVKFDNVDGLMLSNPVYADGYQIGIINEIIYNYDGLHDIVVSVELNDEVKIPKGSTAQIIPEILGGAKLLIMMANNPLESVANGDTIVGTRPKSVMDKASDMVPQVAAILPHIDSVLVSLNRLLSDSALMNSIHNLQTTMVHVNRASQSLDKVMNNQIPNVMTNLEQTTAHFSTISDHLSQIDFKGTMDKIDATLMSVKSFTDKLDHKDSNLGLLLNDRSLYDKLDQTIESADSLLIDLKENPKRYVRFSIW